MNTHKQHLTTHGTSQCKRGNRAPHSKNRCKQQHNAPQAAQLNNKAPHPGREHNNGPRQRTRKRNRPDNKGSSRRGGGRAGQPHITNTARQDAADQTTRQHSAPGHHTAPKKTPQHTTPQDGTTRNESPHKTARRSRAPHETTKNGAADGNGRQPATQPTGLHDSTPNSKAPTYQHSTEKHREQQKTAHTSPRHYITRGRTPHNTRSNHWGGGHSTRTECTHHTKGRNQREEKETQPNAAKAEGTEGQEPPNRGSQIKREKRWREGAGQPQTA